MRTVKLNKATIKDLDNKKPDICYLLENDYITIKQMCFVSKMYNQMQENYEEMEDTCNSYCL